MTTYMGAVSKYAKMKNENLTEAWLGRRVDHDMGLEHCIEESQIPGYLFKIIDKQRYLLAVMKYELSPMIGYGM